MDRFRRTLIGGGAIALLGPAFARARTPAQILRVAVQPAASLNLGHRQRTAAWFTEEGFAEGRNLAIEYADLDLPDVAEIERRARALVASRPDVILVPGGDNIALFKKLTKDISIVFYSLGADPVRMGLVESYRRPGGNVTGTANQGVEVTIKGWELLKELRHRMKRIGAFFDRGYLAGSWVPLIRETQAAAASRLGVERVEIVVPTSAGFAPVERAIRAARIDALDISGGFGVSWLRELMDHLEMSSIPALWESEGFVRSGGLVSVIGNMEEASREAVKIAARILRGANPATIPVHEVTRIVVAINLHAARSMKLAIPESILLRADLVIERRRAMECLGSRGRSAPARTGRE